MNLIDTLGLGTSGNSGDSGMTPESIALRRKLAESLLAQGQSDEPIRSDYQGINRVLQSMLGTYRLKQLDTLDTKGKQEANDLLMSTFGGGQPSASPIPTTPAVVQPSTEGLGTSDASGAAAQPTRLASIDPGTRTDAQPIGEIAPYANAIASVESAHAENPYTAVGPPTRSGDRAYGKYQVMGNNIPEWTQTHLGRRMSVADFVGDPEAQEKVFAGQFGGYLKKYGNPDDAASMWFSGRPAKEGAGSNDLYTSQPEYLKRFNAALGRNKGQQVAGNETGTATDASPAPAQIPPVDPDASPNMAKAIRLMNNPRTAAIGQALFQKMLLADAVPKGTEEIRNYEYARKQGFQGTLNDYQVQMKQAGRPQTNVSVSGDKKGAEEMGKLFAQRYDGIQKNAAGAQGILDNLDTMEQALAQGVNTGGLGEWEQTARDFAASLGLGDLEKASAGSVVQAISNKMALSIRQPGGEGGGMPGAMSDADREFLKATVPGLLKVPGGNAKLIEIMRLGASRHQAIADLAVDYAASHDGQLDVGFDKVVRDYVKANPLSAVVKGMDKGAPGAAPAADQPQKVKTQTINPQTGNALKAGQQARNPGTGEMIQWDGTKWVPMTTAQPENFNPGGVY